MATKTLTPAAERVLDVAGKLFYERGITAVGVEGIAAAAGVTKKTLYDRFGSKAQLVAEYLRRRDRRYREHVEQTLARGRKADRPLLMFDALQSWIERENPRGCAFVNANAELAEPDHPGRAAIAEQKQWQLERLRQLVDEAGVRRPAAVAETLFILLEGATVASTLGVAENAVRTARRTAAAVLAQAKR